MSVIGIKKILNNQLFVFLASNYFVAALAMISTFVVAKILSGEDFGKIRILIAVVTTANVLCTLSFNAAFLKLASGNADFYYVKKLYFSMLNAILVFTLIVVLLLIFIEFIISGFQLEITSFLFFITIFPMSVNLMQVSILQAHNKFFDISKLQAIAKIVSVSLLVVFSYYMGVVGYAIANLLGVFILLIILYREVGYAFEFSKEIENQIETLRPAWRISRYLFLYQVIRKVNLYLDFFIVGIFLNDEEVGSFALVLAFIAVLDVMISTVQQKSAPVLSSRINSGVKWQEVANKYHLINISLVGISSLGMYFIVPELVKILYQEKFTSFSEVFVLLLAAWSIRSFFAIDRVVLTSLGKTEIIYKIYIISLPFSILASLFFITNYGISGAGIGSVTNSIIVGALFTYYKKTESLYEKFIS